MKTKYVGKVPRQTDEYALDTIALLFKARVIGSLAHKLLVLWFKNHKPLPFFNKLLVAGKGGVHENAIRPGRKLSSRLWDKTVGVDVDFGKSIKYHLFSIARVTNNI